MRHLNTLRVHAAAKHIVLCRFAVAAAAFSPFLKKALGSKRIWRGGLELGLWMGLGALLQAPPAPALYRALYGLARSNSVRFLTVVTVLGNFLAFWMCVEILAVS